MPDITARFTLIDEMSDRLANMAESGQRMADALTRAGSSANGAFDNLESSLDRAGRNADDAADRITRIGDAAGDASHGADDLADSLNGSGDAGDHAADGADAAASAEERLRRAFASGAQSVEALSQAMSRTSQVESSLTAAMQRGQQVSERAANCDRLSAETRERLEQASREAEEAQEALTQAQQRADAAMEAYNQALDHGADNVEELERAAREAADAAEDLAEAQRRSEDATRELGDASDEASDEMDNLREHGTSTFAGLQSALAAAGLTATIGQITQALLECSQAAATTETAFKQLQTIAGASPMPMLTEQIKELSASTGIAQSDLAGVAYNAISAGSAVEDAVATAESASKLAVAGFTDTASALSVLSTTMNSYGDAAGDAMDIADSLIMVQNLGVTTVAELSSSMGAAISMASAFNVSMGNLESAYISVTKAGIGTAEATTYISGLMSELGSASSVAAGVLSESTGKTFGQLMADGYSLADVLGILYDAVGQDNEALMNLWGTQTAGLASAAIVNQGLEQFNENLNTVTNSAGATESAYATMANTTEHAQQMLATSTQNLQIAIGDALNPTLTKLYNIGSQAFSWAADFAAENPVIIKCLTALGAALAVATVGIAGAAVATSSLGAAISAAVAAATPFLPIIAGVAAVVGVAVGAFMMLGDAMKEDLGEAEGLTAQSREQYYAIQDLNSQYEAAVAEHGEYSEEALSLKYQVDQLSDSFEHNKETVAQVQTRVDDLCTSVSDLSSSYNENMQSIGADEGNTLALIQRLKELGNQTSWTYSQYTEMEAITQKLADAYPELNVNIGTVTKSTDKLVESMVKQCEAEAEEKRLQESKDTYIQALQKRTELTEELKKAQENLALEQERLDGMNWFQQQFNKEDLEAYQSQIEELNAAMAENEDVISDIESQWSDMGDRASETNEKTISEQEAVSIALSEVQSQIEELGAAYDEAYEKAYSSFDGQFGLFDKAKADMDNTVSAAQQAQESQLAFWTSYNENISTLKDLTAEDLGVSQENLEQTQANLDALMQYVQSGTPEAAGLAQSMVNNIKQGNEEAILNLADTVGKVEEQKEQAATTVADWQTDFNSKMDEITNKMGETVDGLNLSSDATASAKATMDAYAKEIETSGGHAVEKAQDIAKRVAAALSSASTTVSVGTSVPGHAKGTTNAESAFIAGEKGPELIVRHADAYANGTTDSSPFYLAGENGPELIMGEQGSTVFPSSETNRIISALERSPANEAEPLPSLTNPVSAAPVPAPVSYPASGGERHISIDINGTGSIQVDSSVNKEDLLEVLQDNLRPVLMGIIQNEIYEEGDNSYDY